MTYKPYYMKDVLDNSNKELFNVISTFVGGEGVPLLVIDLRAVRYYV